MSTSRDDILNRLAAVAGHSASETALKYSGEKSAENKDPEIFHPIPARARGEQGELVARFVDMALLAGATVARVATAADVPAEVAALMAREQLGDELVMAPDDGLALMPWAGRPRLVIRRGAAQPSDTVAVTPALAGIAETGTLLVYSGAARPNGLHFLVETHIAVLAASDIVGGYEDGWARLADAPLPRAVTFITGPSRTADIERTPQIGVHGPKKLHIVVIDG
jgi:L-lactate dehydrogenase complex protein LldG